MRKRLYAAMLAGVLTLSLSAGCMSAMASETEAGSTQLTESDESQALSSSADETESEATARAGECDRGFCPGGTVSDN